MLTGWLLAGCLTGPEALRAQANLCTPGACKGPNLVFNGSFEQMGPDSLNPILGFETDFGYTPCPPAQTPDLWGNVSLQQNPNTCYWAWNSTDRTLGDGTGYMLLVDFPDANPDGSNDFMRIWSQQIAIESGETYCFGAWFKNLHENLNMPKPRFRFMVDGALIGLSPELPENGNWEYFGFTYTVPANADSVLITIENGKFGGNGNDLAIDDVEFRKLETNHVPPTVRPDEVVVFPQAQGHPIPVLVNDEATAPDTLVPASLRVISDLPPQHGTLSVNPLGEVAFTPEPGFLGQTSFAYEICDQRGCCNQATVLVNVDVILPVEISGFTAVPGMDGVQLGWMVGEVAQHSHFLVMRAAGRGPFLPVATLREPLTRQRTLRWTDRSAPARSSGELFYRLYQVDLNGALSYGGTVATRQATREPSFSLMPNPGTGTQATLRYAFPDARQLHLDWLDLSGRVLQQQALRLPASAGELRLDLPALPAGMYLLRQIGRAHV